MRSARGASAPFAGCEALCAEQTANTPHPHDCRGREAPSATIKIRRGGTASANSDGLSPVAFIDLLAIFSAVLWLVLRLNDYRFGLLMRASYHS